MRPPRQARGDARHAAAADRGQDRRPHDRRAGAAGSGRRAVRARLPGHARLSRRARGHRPGDRRRRLVPHRRPGLDGRRWLRPHRGPGEGHDHPRRREHLSRARSRTCCSRTRRSPRWRSSASPTSAGARSSRPTCGRRPASRARRPMSCARSAGSSLAPYKTPLHWVFVEAFPLTPSGKIQKFRLQEDFARRSPSARLRADQRPSRERQRPPVRRKRSRLRPRPGQDRFPATGG